VGIAVWARLMGDGRSNSGYRVQLPAITLKSSRWPWRPN